MPLAFTIVVVPEVCPLGDGRQGSEQRGNLLGWYRTVSFLYPSGLKVIGERSAYLSVGRQLLPLIQYSCSFLAAVFHGYKVMRLEALHMMQLPLLLVYTCHDMLTYYAWIFMPLPCHCETTVSFVITQCPKSLFF